ncbi:hypothetical protein H2204_004681 [Knufia peltigerae]|uniref:Uncharacterized protein n=2 Tax=Chaetothyriales TaxID=34395 RepID=A0AA39D0M3_9EURO|nr:hypothetical protein H2204_004681 [Knufia peltigerae]
MDLLETGFVEPLDFDNMTLPLGEDISLWTGELLPYLYLFRINMSGDSFNFMVETFTLSTLRQMKDQCLEICGPWLCKQLNQRPENPNRDGSRSGFTGFKRPVPKPAVIVQTAKILTGIK